jgi:hypothetical protein
MPDPKDIPTPTRLLVDGHVHAYENYDLGAWLAGAARNLRRAAASPGAGGAAAGALLLAGTPRDRPFEELPEAAARAGWVLETAAEPGAFRARRARRREGGPEDLPIYLLAGRQVRTREGLEVLGLLGGEGFPDGLPFDQALARVRWSGAVTVVPWGFGKWWFHRGGLVERVLRRAEPGELFLGDNSGRLRGRARPWLFRLAEARGLAVLPGSDPLPFPGCARLAGSYGFVLDGPFDGGRPVSSLRRLLTSLAGSPRPYGRRAGIVRFCRERIQIERRRRAHSLAEGAAETLNAAYWMV